MKKNNLPFKLLKKENIFAFIRKGIIRILPLFYSSPENANALRFAFILHRKTKAE